MKKFCNLYVFFWKVIFRTFSKLLKQMQLDKCFGCCDSLIFNLSQILHFFLNNWIKIWICHISRILNRRKNSKSLIFHYLQSPNLSCVHAFCTIRCFSLIQSTHTNYIQNAWPRKLIPHINKIILLLYFHYTVQLRLLNFAIHSPPSWPLKLKSTKFRNRHIQNKYLLVKKLLISNKKPLYEVQCRGARNNE